MAILAIDAGTSTIKAVAFNRSGHEVYVARRESPVQRPRDGWSEQDMNAVWSLICDATRETASAVKNIESIAITAQGDGCWLIDHEGEPVRPALLWNDGRAAAYIDAWLDDDTAAHVYVLNGSVPFPGAASALLRWISDDEPQSLAASAFALTCGSWIFRKMTGKTCIEFSDAFVPFTDAKTGDYSDELLSLYGLGNCRKLLPPIGSSSGRLLTAAANRIGLRADTPVVLAPYDVPSAALGVGAYDPGDAVAVLGTTFLCGVVRDAPRIEGDPAGCLVPLGLPSRYLRFHATLAGMEVVHWAAKMLGVRDARDVIALAAMSDPGANGLLFMPYLSPAGERAPFVDSAARGSFINLSLDHNRENIARAVVEGLCMVVRDCFEAIGANPPTIRLCGGGTASAVLCQLLADIVGHPVERATASELTSRGAALYAARALGDEDALTSWRLPAEQQWMPDAQRASIYTKQFANFRRMRALAAQQWHSNLPKGCV